MIVFVFSSSSFRSPPTMQQLCFMSFSSPISSSRTLIDVNSYASRRAEAPTELMEMICRIAFKSELSVSRSFTISMVVKLM